jgi:predicted RNase H-like HicB family nuclease
MREFTVLVERGEDGMLIGTVPQLPGCHTQGRSLDQLMERVREAIELVLQDAADFPGQLELICSHRIAV